MSLTINLTDYEKEIAEMYSKAHNINLCEAFKQALFEKIEDESDVMIANEAYEEYEQSGKVSRPITELWKELNLELHD